MGLLGNLVDGFRVKNNDDDNDDYYLDDDYYDDAEEDDYEEEAEEPKSGIFSGLSKRASRKNSSEDQQTKAGGKVVPLRDSSMEVNMQCPKTVNDSVLICDELLNGKAVVINLEGVDGSIAQRIIDFTYGSVYSIEGDLKQISKFIFIASPHSVELSGDFRGNTSKSYMKPEQPAARAVGYGY